MMQVDGFDHDDGEGDEDEDHAGLDDENQAIF